MDASWTIAGQTPALPHEKKSLGYAGPITGVIDDLLIVGGGANFPEAMPWLGGTKKYYSRLFSFRITNDSLINSGKIDSLPVNLAYAACATTSGGIFVGGGENEKGISSRAFLIQKQNNSLVSTPLPDLPVSVTNAAATAIGTNIYLVGGDRTEGVSDLFYKLNTEDPSVGWQQLPSLPHAAANGVLINNGSILYYLGGRKKGSDGISEFYSNVYAFSTTSNNWEEKEPLPYALSAGTGALINKNEIMLFGGDKGSRFHETEKIIQQINAATDSAEKQKLIDQKTVLQKTHPGFSNELLVYDLQKNKWNIRGKLPFTTPVTTTAVTSKNFIFLPSGEIRAGIRTPQILKFQLQHAPQ